MGYNFRTVFSLYEQEKDSPYEFGMIFDYKEDEEQHPCFDIFKLNVLNKNTKFGYYLIIPDGSTCHLKLETSTSYYNK